MFLLAKKFEDGFHRSMVDWQRKTDPPSRSVHERPRFHHDFAASAELEAELHEGEGHGTGELRLQTELNQLGTEPWFLIFLYTPSHTQCAVKPTGM